MDTSLRFIDNMTNRGNQTIEERSDVRVLATSYLTYKIGEYSL